MEQDLSHGVLILLLLFLLLFVMFVIHFEVTSRDPAESKAHNWCIIACMYLGSYIFIALFASFEGDSTTFNVMVRLPIVLLVVACAVSFFVVVGKAVVESIARAEDRLARKSPAYSRARVQGSKLKRNHLVLLVMIGWSIFAVAATVWGVWYVNHKQVNDPGRAFLLFLGILATNGVLLWLNVLAYQHRLRRSAALAADLLPAVNLLATPGLLGVWYFTQIHAP